MTRIVSLSGTALVIALAATAAGARIPSPPPTEAQQAAAAQKKAQDAAKAEQEKAELEAAQDAAVRNYRENMRHEGRPIPRPQPTLAVSTPAAGVRPAPESDTRKVDPKP